MSVLILLPFFVQLLVIGIDEFYFHVRRGLPKWERIGHPLDTLTVVLCFAFILFFPYSSLNLKIYIGLALFSCIFVTKDEFVHKECCPAAEQWLHAFLFLNHPILLTAAGLIWPIISGASFPSWLAGLNEHRALLHRGLAIQGCCTALFLIYQWVYWNVLWKERACLEEAERSADSSFMESSKGVASRTSAPSPLLNVPEKQTIQINNAFYEDLGEGWYEDHAHPIALLRAENEARNPWITERVHTLLGPARDVLDIGCGAGFLTNALAAEGHRVTGVDLSAKSLQLAEKKDLTKSVRYLQLDAFALPFPDESFDVVCAMDFLEHVAMPGQIVREAARLLRPRGLFFFHTFNRNWLSWLIVIKGVEWCVPNTPENMHIYSYFIRPKELTQWCAESGLRLSEMRGLAPRVATPAFWKSLMQRKVDKRLQFRFTSSLSTGYLGVAERRD